MKKVLFAGDWMNFSDGTSVLMLLLMVPEKSDFPQTQLLAYDARQEFSNVVQYGFPFSKI